MMNKIGSMALSLAGLLGLVAGCGKTENAAPVTPPADRTVAAAAAAAAAPEPAIKPGSAATNSAALTPDASKTSLATVSSATDAAAIPVQPVALQTPNPTKPPTAPASLSQLGNSLTGLSQDQMVQGLEEALAKGLQEAVARLGHDGGFLTNLNVRIPMPEKLQKVEKALRAVKEDRLADEFVATMNHAAEQAVPEAVGVFADALRQMNVQDARSILSGPNDAATQYFRRNTETNLYARFYPVVQKATAKTGVTAAYKNLMEKANVVQGLGSFGNALGNTLLGNESMDIDAYVTGKGLEGLFKMVAEEEQQIRQNPVARTTDILQKVFGAFKK